MNVFFINFTSVIGVVLFFGLLSLPFRSFGLLETSWNSEQTTKTTLIVILYFYILCLAALVSALLCLFVSLLISLYYYRFFALLLTIITSTLFTFSIIFTSPHIKIFGHGR